MRSSDGAAGCGKLTMMSILVEELLQLVAEFNDRAIEFALCGGLAVAAHGFTRATQDIDFLIREESLERAYEAAAKVGFDIRGLDMSFKERTVEIRRVSKIVGEDIISLDLLLVTQHVEDVWEEREWKEVEGEVIPIVSRNGLIKMKRQAGRSQDLTDIERLENEAG